MEKKFFVLLAIPPTTRILGKKLKGITTKKEIFPGEIERIEIVNNIFKKAFVFQT